MHLSFSFQPTLCPFYKRNTFSEDKSSNHLKITTLIKVSETAHSAIFYINESVPFIINLMFLKLTPN